MPDAAVGLAAHMATPCGIYGCSPSSFSLHWYSVKVKLTQYSPKDVPIRPISARNTP